MLLAPYPPPPKQPEAAPPLLCLMVCPTHLGNSKYLEVAVARCGGGKWR
jgi:hypothetical protein